MNEIEKLRRIEAEMNRLLVGRREEVRGVVLAVLARQHAILFGPHGEAKSMLLDSFASAISGAKVFTWTVAQDTMPSDLFEAGQDFYIETETLPTGQRQRQWWEPIITGRMLDAHIVLLRELFRGNSATHNATLTAINERYYVDSRGNRRPMPLISLFGDTNNLPGEDLEAYYDRFMLRFVVSRLQEKSLRLEMRRLSEARRKGDKNARMNAEPLNLAELEELQQLANLVEMPARMDELIEEIIERLYDEGVIIYGRRDVRLNTVLKANAFLEGRDAATETDLVEVLPHCLWDNPDDRKKVRNVILAVANPIGRKVQELLDEAVEIRDQALGRKRPDGAEKSAQEFQRGCLEANTKLKRLITGDANAQLQGVAQLLEEARRTGEPIKGIEEAQRMIQRFQKDVFEAATG